MDTKTKKTKVLFVITKSNWGGAQKYVYDLATNLPQETFTTSVALGGHGTLKEKLLDAHIRTISIPFLGRDVHIMDDMRSFFQLIRLFHAERPDIIHLNSSKIGVMGGLAARLARAPYIIFTAHGWAFNEHRSTLHRFIIKIISWVTVLLAHKTIAVSAAIKDDMKFPGISHKVQVLRNGIPPKDLLPKDVARKFLNTLTATRIPDNAFLFGTIAELHPNKGLSYAITAFAAVTERYPDAFYVIIGGGQEYESLKALITEKRVSSRVILLGFLENAASYAKAFDCFVLPSLTEALGYVLLEAGLAELPVIASNIGGIPEIIINKKTGLLIETRSVASLENAMLEILSSPTHKNELGRELSVKVSEEYEFTKALTKTINLYLRK